MSMIDWARREVSLIRDIEKRRLECWEFEEVAECYDAALEAFESLLQPRPMYLDMDTTKNILNRLLNYKPLSPIEDIDDEWEDAVVIRESSGKQQVRYIHKRMESLYKYINANGSVGFIDLSQFQFVSLDSSALYPCDFLREVVGKMYPISMPYTPMDGPITVYVQQFLVDQRNKDFDTMMILYVVKPDGVRYDVNRYFRKGKGPWFEIGSNEYIKRLEKYLRRNKK